MQRGAGWIARLGGYLAGLPGAGRDLPLDVGLEYLGEDSTGVPVERWRRRFGNETTMTSRLHAEDGCLVEDLGEIRLVFRLEATDAGIRWHACRGSLWSWCRMPRAWLRGITAHEYEMDGQYAFEVQVRMPGIGLVIGYRGTLQPEDTAAASS